MDARRRDVKKEALVRSWFELSSTSRRRIYLTLPDSHVWSIACIPRMCTRTGRNFRLLESSNRRPPVNGVYSVQHVERRPAGRIFFRQ